MARYRSDPEHKRIEIYFDNVPSRIILLVLKSNGWQWSPHLNCWYKEASEFNEEMAESICREQNRLNQSNDAQITEGRKLNGEENFDRCCYAASLCDFLNTEYRDWILQMQKSFHRNLNLPLEDLQIEAWKDSYNVLKEQLIALQNFGKEIQIVFEYILPYESGRRPDVLLIDSEHILVLEFKKKSHIFQSDIDQVNSYCRDLKEYHLESRMKCVLPFLVITQMHDVDTHYDDLVHICSGDQLGQALLKSLECYHAQRCDLSKWLNSRYEPLPTIVEAARLIMQERDLPQIRRADSTGIPDALNCLEKVTKYAKEHEKHILVMATGVPGAGKTLLGLQYVYSTCRFEHEAHSVYLSGNGPLVRVLTDALDSRVFVKDLHKIINEYLSGRGQDFSDNVIVFDEGQRAWDKERMSKDRRGQQCSEPDLIIQLAERQLKWCVLLVLIGEGQEIYRGENAGIIQWNTALNHSRKKWEILCPDKLTTYFKGQKLLRAQNRNKFDLTTSLRTHLSGEVSTFVNCLISGNILQAEALVPQILSAGFTMCVTRSLEAAKQYCISRYKGQITKRYGMIASSKESQFMTRYGVDNSFQATSLRYMNIGKWFNSDARSGQSCCNFNKVVTEFGCQGLELDMPVICWGPDMRWQGENWAPYQPNQAADSDENVYRRNSYRVLLTRGRDGFVIYVPDDKILDVTYNMFVALGFKNLDR